MTSEIMMTAVQHASVIKWFASLVVQEIGSDSPWKLVWSFPGFVSMVTAKQITFKPRIRLFHVALLLA